MKNQTEPSPKKSSAFTLWWRKYWAHWWFKTLVLLIVLWFVRAIPAGVQRGMDAYNGSVVVTVSASNYLGNPIGFFEMKTPRGTSAGGGSIFGREPPMSSPAGNGMHCCRELQLRYDDQLLVTWRFSVSVDEHNRGIRPPPARQALVPIEIDNLPIEQLTDLQVYFFENGDVAVKLSDLSGVRRVVPTVRTASHLAPPGFDKETS